MNINAKKTDITEGGIRDPFGNIWWIREHTQEITDKKEIEKRAGDPQAIAAMEYVQGTLDEELKHSNNNK